MTGPLKDTGCKPQSHGQAVPGGGRCPLCDRPRCTAAAKTRPGERCRKNPHPGASICTNHGLTQAGRAAAADRRQLEHARALAVTMGAPREVDPHTALLEELYEAAGEVAYLGAVVRELEKDDVVWGRAEVTVQGEKHRAGVNVWVRLWHEARDRKLRAADRCVAAGIEERRVRLAESAGQQLAAVLRAVLDRMLVAVLTAVLEVLPESVDLRTVFESAFRAAWAEAALAIVPDELRRLAGDQVVSGEVVGSGGAA